MPRENYYKEHHEKAYQVWREARTYTRVAEVLGIGLDTARAWAKADFNCVQGCPWHNWEKLAADEAEEVTRRMKLYEEGNVDPIAHGIATADVIRADGKNPKAQEARRKVMDQLVRSDLERAAQWELLWGKVFYQVTGVCLDHRKILQDGAEVTTTDLYKQGLKVTNMEGGIRALQTIENQITHLKERMGVHKANVQQIVDEEKKEPDIDLDTLSIEDVRKFQALMENTPPDQIEFLKRMMRADAAAVDRALGKPPVERRAQDRVEGRLGDITFDVPVVPPTVPVTNEQQT